MRIRDKHNDDDDIEVDMSPMIDMVFLLLIFFLVASTVIEDKVKVKLPEAVYARVPKNIKGRAIISVPDDDHLYFGKQSIGFEDLPGLISAALDADPKVRIQIREGKKVKFKTSEKVMDACGEAGAVDLIFSAYEEMK